MSSSPETTITESQYPPSRTKRRTPIAIKAMIAKAYAKIGAILGKQWVIVIHNRPIPKAQRALQSKAFLKLNLSHGWVASGFDNSFYLASSSSGKHILPESLVADPVPAGHEDTQFVFYVRNNDWVRLSHLGLDNWCSHRILPHLVLEEKLICRSCLALYYFIPCLHKQHATMNIVSAKIAPMIVQQTSVDLRFFSVTGNCSGTNTRSSNIDILLWSEYQLYF